MEKEAPKQHNRTKSNRYIISLEYKNADMFKIHLYEVKAKNKKVLSSNL